MHSRVVHEIFEKIKCKNNNIEFNLSISMVELVDANIIDLLDQSKFKFPLKNQNSLENYIENLTKIKGFSEEEFLNLIKHGYEMKSIEKINQNSQIIIFFYLTQKNLENFEVSFIFHCC